MNVSSATESDLALRIRRALRGGIRRMGTRSRALVALSLCAMATVTLPYSGTAGATEGDDFDWEKVASIEPQDWLP